MSSRFTEQETETYYDRQDDIYRSVWDEEGSVHWGLFDDNTGDDFLKACNNLNNMMAEKGQIKSTSNVLDLGCGNGTTAIWLNNDRGCHVTGVDLCGVRISNAQKARTLLSQSAQNKLAFEKASAAELPFEDGSFTHLWSQATIYHVPDKKSVLEEAFRILKPGGIMIFDALSNPKPNISADAQKFVYDRLLYDTPFSFESYQDTLKAHGFKVIEAHDLSAHLKNSYILLAGRVPTNSTEHAEHYKELANSYIETARAVDNQDLGWGFYVCQK